MSLINILAIGKIKNRALKELEQEYLDRLSRYTACDLRELKDSSAQTPQKKISDESKNILERIPPGTFVIILDKMGQQFTSERLAKFIQEKNNRGIKGIFFIIGGAYGLSDEIKKRSNHLLSLSTLTLTHELARVILFEQLYRAHTILRGEKYHH